MNFMSRSEVLKQLGISLRTLKRWERSRGFPKPFSASEQVKVYDSDQIVCWLRNLNN